MKHLFLFENFQKINFSKLAAAAIKYLTGAGYEVLVNAYKNEENINTTDDDNEIMYSEDFKKWLIYDFEYNCERIFNLINSLKENDNKIRIFRALKVDDVWLENPSENLGIYWSYDKKSVDTHWGDYSKKYTVILEAFVNFKNINMTNTILANVSPDTGEQEKEITLYKNSPVELLHIWKNDEDIKFPFKKYIA